MIPKFKKGKLFTLYTLAVILPALFFTIDNTNFNDFRLSFSPNFAHADGTTLNTDSQDFETLRASNYTKFPDTTENWHTQIDADAGDTVSLAIYYHNTGLEDATNVRVSVLVPNDFNSQIVSSGNISADNASANGNATINLTSVQNLTYIEGSAKWFPNQSTTPEPFPFGQTGDEFVTEQGVNIGNISPGWQTQGSVVARFKVSNNEETQSQTKPDPTVDLKVNNSDGPVLLSQSEDLVLSWSSQNSINCEILDPINSGVGISGSSSFSPIHPLYPSATSTTYVMSCDNGEGKNATDSVLVLRDEEKVASASVDITANGLQGPVYLSDGESFTLEWISSNVQLCSLAEPVNSSVAQNGNAGPIDGAHPYYPATGSHRTFVINCKDAYGNQISDFVTVYGAQIEGKLNPPIISAETNNNCGGRITVSWSAVSGAGYYQIYRDGVHILNSTGDSFTDTGLIPGKSYTYTAKSGSVVSGIEYSDFSNEASAVASGDCSPASPSLDITANGSQGPVILSAKESFTLDWISSNVSNCELSSQDIFSGLVAQNGSAGPIDYTHPYYPSPGTSRTYTIKCDSVSGGKIEDSVVVTAQVEPPSRPEFNAQTDSQCGGRVLISWNAVSGASEYRIYRDNDLIATTTDSYSFTDSGLQPNSSHAYEVRAANNSGESTFGESVEVNASGQCASAPNAPVVSATTREQCGGEILISWNFVDGATSYKIYRDNNLIATTNSNNFFDKVNPASTYTYYVVATNNVGDSPNSNYSSAISSNACPNPPSAPTLSAVTSPQCGGKIDLSWNLIEGATSYKVFRGGELIAQTNLSQFEDSGLATNQSFVYTVKAVNADGDSEYSNGSIAISSVACPLPPSVNLSANPSTISKGQNSTLSWTSSNVTSCTGSWGQNISQIGEATVSPSETTVYTIICIGPGGTVSDTATVVVNIPECQKPNIVSDLSISGKRGNALSYEILAISNEGPIISYTATGLPSGLSFSGNMITGVPTVYGTYFVEISATNSCGTVLRTLSIEIQKDNDGGHNPIPTVTLSASPSTISKGQNSTLTWDASNVSACSATWTLSTAINGNQSVSPTETTTYTINCTGQYGAVSASVTVNVNVPPPPPPTDQKINLVTTKIVCDNESDLPNWGLGGPDISSTTATNWVNAHSGCHFESGWSFEWGPYNANDPGRAFLGVAGQPWNTFGVTDSFGVSSTSISIKNVGGKIWIREVLKDGYIPFTYDESHQNNNNNVSAEMYCDSDVLNYDNYDFINNLTSGKTYYCVAWNVLKNPVVPKPEVSLSANPSTINLGATSTLTWTSINAQTCSAPWTSKTDISGEQVVSPSSTTEYSITCTGLGGSVLATTTINVTTGGGGGNNQIFASLVANPSIINLGATSTLTWTSTNANSCSATWTTSTSTSGFEIVSPATTTAYTITCSNSGSSASASATVNVVVPQNPAPTVSLNADPSTITQGGSSTLSWSSNNVLTCSADWTSATSTSGSQLVSPASTTDYVLNCSGIYGSVSATTTVVVNPLAPVSGGGGGGRSGDRNVSTPLVLGESLSCDYLRDYLHIGWKNDPVEVIKLQVFLRELEGFKNLPVTSIFDKATFDAVAEFQVRYQGDILSPWGYADGEYTGFVYILTKKKINEIVCKRAYPLNSNQEQEIEEFKAFLESLRSRGINISSGISNVTSQTVAGANESFVSGTALTENGSNADSVTRDSGEQATGGLLSNIINNENVKNVAAAVFAGPHGWEESLNSILLFFTILLALYLLVRWIFDRKGNNNHLTSESLKIRKTFAFIIGLIISTVCAIVFKAYSIVLPIVVLIVLLSIALLWLTLSKREIRTLVLVENKEKENK